MGVISIRFSVCRLEPSAWSSIVRTDDSVWLGWVRRRVGGRPHCDWEAVTTEGLPVEMRGVRIRTASEGAEILSGISEAHGDRPGVRPCGHVAHPPRGPS